MIFFLKKALPSLFSNSTDDHFSLCTANCDPALWHHSLNDVLWLHNELSVTTSNPHSQPLHSLTMTRTNHFARMPTIFDRYLLGEVQYIPMCYCLDTTAVVTMIVLSIFQAFIYSSYWSTLQE